MSGKRDRARRLGSHLDVPEIQDALVFLNYSPILVRVSGTLSTVSVESNYCIYAFSHGKQYVIDTLTIAYAAADGMANCSLHVS